MSERRRAATPAAFLALATLIMAACGGTPAATTSASEVPGASAPTASEPAASQPAASLDLPSLGAIPSFDLDALSAGLPGVDSYRTETSVGGVKQFESVVVTEPELSRAITVYDESGEVAQRLVVIGDQAWAADGADGAFQPLPGQLANSMLLAFDPALMLGGFAAVDWGGAAANQGMEDKNGVQAHHLRIDSTSVVGGAAAMPPGSAVDIWVADAGYLVAWEMSGFPNEANFSIQVTNVNDPANKVEAPV